MYVKFIVIILSILSVSNCMCGVVNWFNGWNDDTGFGNVGGKPSDVPILGSGLTKREFSLPQNERMCRTCMSQLSCSVLKKCNDCYKYCKNNPNFINEPSVVENNAETVGLSNRVAQSVSKTLFPIANLKNGEAMDLVCKIVGISDTSDIESVSISVTTISNKPPISPNKAQNENSNSSPVLESRRFMDYDSGEEPSAFAKASKINPGLIEGSPPFLQSSLNEKPIIVQPKEFQSDESKSEELQITTNEPVTTPDPDQTKKLESLNQLEDANTPKGKSFSILKGPRQANTDTNNPNARRGLLQNFLHGSPSTKNDLLVSSPRNTNLDPLLQKSPKDPVSVSQATMSNINQALQEVKSMVKNIQEETQNASPKRLLESPHVEETSRSPLHTAVPPQVVDNFKDVNHYLINRVQDALNTIGTPSESSPRDDEHSQSTKRIIHDLKKVPTFLLGKFKESLNVLEQQPTNPVDAISQSARFADVDEEVTGDEADSLVGLTERPELIYEKTTSQPTKSKLEKYLADLKERRQSKYSPERFHVKSTAESTTVPTLFSRNEITENTQRPLISQKSVNNAPKSSNLMDVSRKSADEHEMKMNMLKDKMRRYVEDLKKPLEQRNGDFPVASSRIDQVSKHDGHEKLRQIFKEAVQDPNRELLRKKLKDYVESFKKPIESRFGNVGDIGALGSKLSNPVIGRGNEDVQLGEVKQNLEETSENVVNGTVKSPELDESKMESPLDDAVLGSRAGFKNEDLLPYSGNLGQIVQSSSKPQDIFFIGDGIKLPLKIGKSADGTLDISVNLDKLCSCQNTTCPRNHSAIEETVGAILEKEAELKEQLNEGEIKTGNVIAKRSPNVGLFTPEINAAEIFKKQANSYPKSLENLAIERRQHEIFSNAVRQVQEKADEMKKQVSNSLKTPLVKNSNEVPLLYNGLLRSNLRDAGDAALNKIAELQLQSKKNLNLPKLFRNPVADISNNWAKLTDASQYSQISKLQETLNRLENKVEDYTGGNAKIFQEKSKKLFGVHKNDIVEKEVDLVGKILTWLNNLPRTNN
ncbi:putative leucine-rich repeat-containing protein DDB_G0290503 isoform X2 [Euwallacea similis]|uniref:putative leucine-rich repeat-containing protein DDB_G0290503 isoform X2 n=1 Tax=Euwallacea similis TaxID=1736056 RepID=UPI00344B4C49